MIDLGLYEIGNVLVRALSWDPVDVARKLQGADLAESPTQARLRPQLSPT